MPPPRSLAPALLLAAALAAAAAPLPAAAEGGAAAPPAPPKEEEADKEVFHRDLVDFEPFDRAAPAGENVRLKFRLKGGFRSPVLVVVFPDGGASYFRPDVSNGREHEIPFRLDRIGGTHRVALVASNPSGERIAAHFLLRALSKEGKELDRDVDYPPADAVYPPLDPEEHPLRLERHLFHRMNAFRAKHGLPPLPWHEGVARSAREHLAEVARHFEETVNPRTGAGLLLHRIPGAGYGGTEGPTLADRVRQSLAWPIVLPYLPPENPDRARGSPNYVSETLGSNEPSLDHKFEQTFLRKSDLRAPLLSPWTTHAAGAATWRYYGWRKGDGSGPKRFEPPGPPPGNRPREVFTALVFVQVNDPAAAATWERERREVLRAVPGTSGTAEKAAALRLLGQCAVPESPGLLAEAARSRDPAVQAAALDGLWLCAPAEARRLTDPLRVRTIRAFEDEEESRAAGPLRVLEAVRYDAASRRAGAEGFREASARARALLDAADAAAAAGKTDGARALLEAARRRFAGFPEEKEAEAGLRRLEAGAPTAPTPPPGAK